MPIIQTFISNEISNIIYLPLFVYLNIIVFNFVQFSYFKTDLSGQE
jgi:hypothetical protein